MLDYWKKHTVAIVNVSGKAYSLDFITAPGTPVLDQYVHAWRDEKGKPFPPGDLKKKRVAAHTYNVEKNSIECFPVSWGQYALLTDPKIRQFIPEKERFKILAMACVIRTIDQKIVFSFRSQNVSHYKNMWHVSVGGVIDLKSARKYKSVIPQFFQELKEELGIEPKEVISYRQLGFCEYLPPNDTSKEVCLTANVTLTSGEVEKRARLASDNWEGKVITLPEREVRKLIKHETFTPGGAATVILALGL